MLMIEVLVILFGFVCFGDEVDATVGDTNSVVDVMVISLNSFAIFLIDDFNMIFSFVND